MCVRIPEIATESVPGQLRAQIVLIFSSYDFDTFWVESSQSRIIGDLDCFYALRQGNKLFAWDDFSKFAPIVFGKHPDLFYP